jgi:phosphohistidine swiveling domain-containing protein
LSWLSELAELLHLRSVEPRHRLHALRFRNLAGNVRRLCELSDEARDRLVGGWVLDRRYLASFVERSMDLAEEVYFDSSVLAPGHRPRYSALDELRARLTILLSGRSCAVEPALVVPLEDADLVEEDLVGPGPRLLAEAARRLGTPLAPGFVITAAAFRQALEHKHRHDGSPSPRGPDAARGPEIPRLPDPLRQSIDEALRAAGSPEAPVAFLLFSGASGSPTAIEEGPMATVEAVVEAYQRLVSRTLASRPRPTTPGPETGSPGQGAVSCVLVGQLIERGTLCTCDPENPLALRLVVSSNGGSETHLFDRYPIGDRGPARVPDGYRPLIRMALALERLAGRPQTVAWARPSSGFRPLDSGPVVFADGVESPGPGVAEALKRHELLGRPAGAPSVAGIAAGPLKHVRRGEDLAGADDHSVLVLHQGGPLEIDSTVAQRAAALLVRDESAAEPWMGLAREARLPLLAGLDRALDAVPDGELVTVDADEGTVYRGLVHELLLYQLLEPTGGTDDAELRLLASLMQEMGRAGRQEEVGRDHGGPATLFDLVQEAHSAALRSFESIAEGGWGTRTGTPLVETGWPGTLRIVDVGGGTDRTGRGVWPGGLDAQRLRCLPLLVFLEPFGRGRNDRGRRADERASGLAMVAEDSLTLHVQWPGGSMVMDARLSEYPGSNTIYCAFGPGGRVVSTGVLASLGFRRVELGPDRATWLLGREYEETRRGLHGLARELARLLPPGETGPRQAAESEVASGPTDAAERRG